MLGQDVFAYEARWLADEVQFLLEYWLGRRAPTAVPIDESWKCRWCDFHPECSARPATVARTPLSVEQRQRYEQLRRQPSVTAAATSVSAKSQHSRATLELPTETLPQSEQKDEPTSSLAPSESAVPSSSASESASPDIRGTDVVPLAANAGPNGSEIGRAHV